MGLEGAPVPVKRNFNPYIGGSMMNNEDVKKTVVKGVAPVAKDIPIFTNI